MRSKSDKPAPRRFEPTLGAESEQSFADQLRLEELPDQAREETPAVLPARRRTRTSSRWMASAVGVIAFLILTFACLTYLWPTLSGQISRGVQALIEDAVRVRASIDARSRQAATPTEAERRTREAARREAVWKDFFHRSPRCVIEANQSSVECVNQYIRARRDFDQRWDAGQL
jgi:hypothetical protein